MGAVWLTAWLASFAAAQAPASGRALFDATGCGACHKIAGRGGNSGPDLTFVGFRRKPRWLDAWLSDPRAWKHDTLMPNYRLRPGERQALVEYLSSLTGQNFPHDQALTGRALFNAVGCVACHGAQGRGGHPDNNVPGGLIPSLTQAAQGYTPQELKRKISEGSHPEKADPSGPEPLVAMPAWGQALSPAELDALTAYVLSLSPRKAGPEDFLSPWLDWLGLALRWLHVVAGVMWIGQTYLFNWLERTFTPPDNAAQKPNISGELWMVHGGGFYLVEKQKWPEIMPRTLHWFKWEAMMTWLSGFFLLVVVYWCGAPLLPYGTALSRLQGIGISAGVLAGGLVVYHLLWNWSPLRNHEGLGIVVSWLLLLALTWGLTQVLSDRAAYLHIGAMFGTIMVVNVWGIILPNQRRIMAITEAGGAPEPELSRQAGRCSRHNTYMSVPLIFTMISNHFPNITFGRDWNWLILGVIILIGWAGAKLIRDVL